MPYSQQVYNQQQALNQANLTTPGYNPIAVDGYLGQQTQTAFAQYGQPSALTMVNGSPIIPTTVLTQNGTFPQMPPATASMTPQQFVAGLTPITTTPLQAINPTAQGATKAATAQIGTLQNQQSSLSNRLAAAQQQLLGQGNEQLRLEGAAGIPQSVKDVNALNEQITGLKAAFDAKIGATDTNTFGVNAQSTRINAINRQSAIQLGGLSALLMAKQGSLEAAKAEVDRTLKFEFDPIKQEIENTKTFLDLNNQNFSRAEQSQASALKVQLDRENRAVENAQQDRRFNATMALDLYKQGAIDQNSFSEILSGKSNIYSALKNSNVNLATIGDDPLTTLQGIIKTNSVKTDDKLKLTGAVIASAQKFAENNPTGDFAGLGPIRAGFLTVGQKGQSNRSYLSGLKGTVESWMTGAAVSEDQQKRIEKDLIPKQSDTDWQVRNKINALTNYMLDYASGNLATQGVNYRPPTVNLFTIKTDPLGLGIDMSIVNSTNPLGLQLF